MLRSFAYACIIGLTATAATAWEASVDCQITMANADKPIEYKLRMMEEGAAADDSIAPCSYLIISRPEGIDGAEESFAAYFDGNFYKFKGDRLTEWHISESPLPFKGGVVKAEMFANLLPSFLREAIAAMDSDTTYIYNVENGGRAMAGRQEKQGYVLRNFEYRFDEDGKPESVEITINPSAPTEQTMTATYNYSDTGQLKGPLSEEMLAGLFPEAFSKFREGNLALSSFVGKPMPTFSAPTLDRSRLTHQRGEGFGSPTLIAFIEKNDSATVNTIREAATDTLDIIYAFLDNGSESAGNTVGQLRPNEKAMTSARSLANTLGIKLFPSLILCQKNGKIGKISEGMNKNISEFVKNIDEQKTINNKKMATVYFKSTPVEVYGQLPVVGSIAPEFHLTSNSLTDISRADFPGKRIVLNIFPSLDTEVCAASVRRFNQEATKIDNVAVVCVSMDLPFAMSRFCTINGIENVVPASAFRSPEFAKDYGVMMVDGPLKGLLARAVVVLDEDGRVIYTQLVEEITDEPDYEAAISVLKQ